LNTSNPRGITPITSNGVPSTTMDLPTIALSPPIRQRLDENRVYDRQDGRLYDDTIEAQPFKDAAR
jgi:hypothetical protein